MEIDDDLSGYGETTEDEKLRLLRDCLTEIRDVRRKIEFTSSVASITAILVGIIIFYKFAV